MTRFLPISLVAALCLLTGSAVLAQTTPTTGRSGSGYTYEVKPALAGQRVFVCAQHPIDENGNVVGKNDLNAQTEQIMKNISSELEKRGLTLKHIKQVSYRMKDYTPSSNAVLSAASSTFAEFHPGIADYKNVASFQREGMLLEIEVVAVK
ncbi:RidA family protein [Fibrella aquatica]|uniref:RidA family protein n=1 Tax=Fibrella aquatica TaxID=3242487 RepID=UPI00352245AB